MPRTFYRIVKTASPGREDFMSDRARGIPPPDDDPRRLELHDGISVWNTLTQARNKARDLGLGDYIAVLEIPAGAPVRYERTLSSRGHHIVWDVPEYLITRVVAIVPV